MRMLRGLTFELTPRAEAGGVSPECDDATTDAGRAYAACRSESGVERVVRPHSLPRTWFSSWFERVSLTRRSQMLCPTTACIAKPTRDHCGERDSIKRPLPQKAKA